MKQQEIFIEVLTDKYSISIKKTTQIIEKILRTLNVPRASLNMRFVSDQMMVASNKKAFGKNRSTDVISFPWKQLVPGTCQTPITHFLGDIIISVDRAYYQSPDYGTSFNEELVTYVIHGILHCMGYDDVSSVKKRKMFMLQDKILGMLRKKGALKNKIVTKH